MMMMLVNFRRQLKTFVCLHITEGDTLVH